jgi:hypothetical protein
MSRRRGPSRALDRSRFPSPTESRGGARGAAQGVTDEHLGNRALPRAPSLLRSCEPRSGERRLDIRPRAVAIPPAWSVGTPATHLRCGVGYAREQMLAFAHPPVRRPLMSERIGRRDRSRAGSNSRSNAWRSAMASSSSPGELSNLACVTRPCSLTCSMSQALAQRSASIAASL